MRQQLLGALTNAICDACIRSFGCLLYYMASNRTLLQVDLNDNVSKTDLKLLSAWSSERLNGMLEEHDIEQKHAGVAQLLRQLLHPDPKERLAAFKHGGGDAPGGISGVLAHKFFKEDTRADDLTADALMKKLDDVVSEVQKGGGAKVDEVIDKTDNLTGLVRAQTRLMATLMKNEREVPSLVCFVPVVSEEKSGAGGWDGWWRRAAKAAKSKEWLNQEVDLYFIDPVGLQVAEGHAFRLRFQREWVAKAMPYIKIGLTVLKTASAVSKIAGFPVPDVAGFIGDQLDFFEGIRDEAVAGLCGAIGADAEDAAEAMESLDSRIAQAAQSAIGDAAPVESGPLDEKVGQYLQASAAQLGKWLDSVERDWRGRTGLVPAVCGHEGLKEWVLPGDKDAFEAQGSKLLGSRAPRRPQQQQQQQQPESRQQAGASDSYVGAAAMLYDAGAAARSPAAESSPLGTAAQGPGAAGSHQAHQGSRAGQPGLQTIDHVQLHQEWMEQKLEAMQTRIIQEMEMRLMQRQQPQAMATAAAAAKSHPLAVPQQSHGDSAAVTGHRNGGAGHQAPAAVVPPTAVLPRQDTAAGEMTPQPTSMAGGFGATQTRASPEAAAPSTRRGSQIVAAPPAGTAPGSSYGMQ